MAAMDSFLITVDGSEYEVSTGNVRHLLDTSARFWFSHSLGDPGTAITAYQRGQANRA